MPTKNRGQDDLYSYKVHFVDKSAENFHTSDDLIKVLSKDDEGGYHPLVFDKKGLFVINMDNVLYIEDITPDEPKAKQ